MWHVKTEAGQETGSGAEPKSEHGREAGEMVSPPSLGTAAFMRGVGREQTAGVHDEAGPLWKLPRGLGGLP